MKRIYLFLSLAFSVNFLFANSFCLNITGTVKFDRKSVNEASITILKDGSEEAVVSSDDKGKFRVMLEKGHYYIIEVSKTGYYSPKVLINTKIEDDENYCWTYKFIVDLVPEINNTIKNDLIKPLGYIAYNENTDEFESMVQKGIVENYEAFISSYEQSIESEYKRLIAIADKALLEKNCELALEYYNKAKAVDSYSTYPDMQIDLIDTFRAKYNRSVQMADNFFNVGDYKKAKKLYKKAINIREDQYLKQQVAKINELMNGDTNLAVQQ